MTSRFQVAYKKLLQDLSELHALSRGQVRYRVTSTVRDHKEQQMLFDRRQRTLAGTLRPGEKPQRFPVAVPGTSQHEIGEAADIVITGYPGIQQDVGLDWRDAGYGWYAKDAIHFQYKPIG